MSEVSKAAERLSKNGYSSTIELDAAGPTGFVIVNGGTWDDVTDLADWALPLLDETAIDNAWLESAGFECMGEALMYGYLLGGLSSFAVHPTPVSEATWTFKTREGMVADVPPPKTRGAVRMLCLSLGITLTEPPQP